jgi:D-methionine transport system ATP-binding protein
MIVLKGVSKQYAGLAAVQDVNLTVADGSIFGIIGKSGAGKSTLLRIMSLLETPDSGEMFHNSERVDTLRGDHLLQKRRKMGMIFQNFNLFSSRNVMGNISYPLEIAGWSKKDIAERVDELLNMVQIADKRKSRLRELSGGQKQRVAIARALAARPNVLFCDEATSALDPQTTRAILALLKDLQKQLQITVIIVTHQMEVVRLICQDVAVMEAGRIVETGSADEILKNPKTQATRDLVNVQV